ncbi:hypothetical protein EDM53_02630 [Rickettsiales endosymbiont of Peranema trichophorum]|uniref:hypothetical protein n=1 Tax=Rickettsiales endosymbiont of Peranema trichophorum TaxID=2486577 RepID=UPI0010238853|nr:hypothetical protein [Rickettsiales endosymbiont of Peranema trichophorum]RZI47342.1 hypothetical protein EDM53_02630 [Rickettsiales endosymbiont of Peranema trichophorum]
MIRRHSRIGLITFVTVAMSILVDHCYNPATHYQYSVSNALNYYGFGSNRQKNAIQNLLQRSSVIPADKTLEQAFPPRATKRELSADISKMINKMAKNFLVDDPISSPSNAESLEWMNRDHDLNLSDLRDLGFVDQVKPTEESIDVLCILGEAPRVVNVMKYANALIESGLKTKKIIVLASERRVKVGLDGSEEELTQIAHRFNLRDWTALKERELVTELYNRSLLYSNDHIPRATIYTLEDFAKWLKHNDEIQSIIFVSSQPYVTYHRRTFDHAFEGSSIKYQVVGCELQDTENLEQGLGALALYMLGAAGYVVSDMELDAWNKPTTKHP